MHDYHVVWSREAIYDVADIADYIELRFGRERADRFNDEIDAEGEALGRDFRMYTGTGIYYRKKLILKKMNNWNILLSPTNRFYFNPSSEPTVQMSDLQEVP